MDKSILYAGVDVSADWIDAARQVADSQAEHRRFANEPAGHKALVGWLSEADCLTQVAAEASGVYSTDLCLTLHAANGIEVMVLNPRAAKDYRCSQMQRSKTDRIDAGVLCDYARRMPFAPGSRQKTICGSFGRWRVASRRSPWRQSERRSACTQPKPHRPPARW